MRLPCTPQVPVAPCSKAVFRLPWFEPTHVTISGERFSIAIRLFLYYKRTFRKPPSVVSHEFANNSIVYATWHRKSDTIWNVFKQVGVGVPATRAERTSRSDYRVQGRWHIRIVSDGRQTGVDCRSCECTRVQGRIGPAKGAGCDLPVSVRAVRRAVAVVFNFTIDFRHL